MINWLFGILLEWAERNHGRDDKEADFSCVSENPLRTRAGQQGHGSPECIWGLVCCSQLGTPASGNHTPFLWQLSSCARVGHKGRRGCVFSGAAIQAHSSD